MNFAPLYPYLVQAATFLGLLALGYLGYRLKQNLEAGLGIEKYKLLKDRALMIVRYIEQAAGLSGLSNEEKKIAAVAKLTAFAHSLGIDLTPEEADFLVEAAVKVMKELTK